MRARSIAALTACRTRASSNGGRDTLKTRPNEKLTGYEITASVGSRATSGVIVGEMPATSRSPLTRPANFVVGSSTTATMKRPRCGGPPIDGGKASFRSKIHRSPAWRSRKTKGPLPRGAVAKASRRKSARGTFPRRCSGTMGSSQSTVGRSGSGRRATSVSVVSSRTSTRSSQANSLARGDPVAGSRTASRVKATSCAVVGVPSCQRSAGSSEKVTARRSGDQLHRRA